MQPQIVLFQSLAVQHDSIPRVALGLWVPPIACYTL